MDNVNQAADYSLNIKIIEDGGVPLSSGTPDYSGIVFIIVLISIAIALIVMYGVWYNNHRKRIAQLYVMGIDGEVGINGMEKVSIFHPIRTIRFENELENMVVSSSAKGV
ncbi:MAG: hypothetical protein K6G57_04195 [Lachnospiraceae bacterium]|nr:hypothetical protein [Lachnospiraceae bacterium]